MREAQYSDRFADEARGNVDGGDRAARHQISNFKHCARRDEQNDEKYLPKAPHVDGHQRMVAVEIFDQYAEREQRNKNREFYRLNSSAEHHYTSQNKSNMPFSLLTIPALH